MRYAPVIVSMLLGCLTPAAAQISINFGAPGVSIGINLPIYPTLQRIPGYPVYYAPSVQSNYFFYDGLYWVYKGDEWYASSWYNGPWRLVDRFDVPVFLLRVPVRYYRHAPSYFRGWRADAPPRWGEHWGQSWEQRRSGWEQWNRNSAPTPAPLPTYQRQYSGDRYPQQSQQAVIVTQNYRYQPQDPVARQHFEHQRTQARSESARQPTQPTQAAPRQQPAPQQHAAPQREPTQPRQQEPPKTGVAKAPQQTPGAREQQAPHQSPQKGSQDKGGEDKGKDPGKGKGEDKGKGHEKDKDKKD